MASRDPEPSYTVFVRLPFPRGDFIDPPPVEWDATKDKALWKILSKTSNKIDIDWSALATKFEVSLAFLLQQAAWAYERQLLQVRAQMRKAGVSKGSSAPSPVPGSASEFIAGEMMRRTGSGGGQRVSSALSSRKDSPALRNEPVMPAPPGRPLAPPLSRTSSANTTAQSRNIVKTSPRPLHATLHRRSHSPNPRSTPPSTAQDPRLQSPRSNSIVSSVEASPEESSSDSDSDSGPPIQSRLLRRPPRLALKKQSTLTEDADGDDEDDVPAFMPLAGDRVEHGDPSATLRGELADLTRRPPTHRQALAMDAAQHSQTSDSSASSVTAYRQRLNGEISDSGSLPRPRPTGPLSPRRTLELAGRSPVTRVKGRDGSDGTPSMGSSFSDLDDASVTQSALEEALASNMQAGGMASRMSTISQALRSRYL